MIVISGDLEIDPSKEDAFLAAVGDLVSATRAEDGCVRYEFFRHLSDPGVFHVSEEWASDAALDSHLATDHYRTFGRAMRDFGVKRVDIDRYDAVDKRKLG